MKIEDITNILEKFKYPIDMETINIEIIKRIEDGSNYNVYKIITDNETLLLKQSSLEEIKNYEFLNKISNINVPKIYETIIFDNKTFILEQFIVGDDLCLCTKDKLITSLNELIKIQNLYWDMHDIDFGIKKEEFYERIVDRKKYLNDKVLEEAYSIFLNVYNSLPKTITHCDLLPFNVIVSEDKSYIIDWEECGYLPFPLSFARLIAYGENKNDFLFHMSDTDKKFAIDYYYEKLLKNKSISYEEWKYILNCFLLYEYCEWIMLRNKSNDNNLEYYNKYFPIAKKYAEDIIKDKNKYKVY